MRSSKVFNRAGIATSSDGAGVVRKTHIQGVTPIHVAQNQRRTRAGRDIGEAAVHSPGMEENKLGGRNGQFLGRGGFYGVLQVFKPVKTLSPVTEQRKMAAGDPHDATRLSISPIQAQPQGY